MSATGGAESSIENSRNFFNKSRLTASKELEPVFQHVFEVTKRLVPNGGGHGTAVDLGCHWGRYTTVLAESYQRVYGVDFADEALDTAEARSNIAYVRLDLNSQARELSRFMPVNCFLGIAIFEMLQSPEDVLRCMYAAGAADCQVLLLVPNRRSLNFLSLRIYLWVNRLFRKGGHAIFNNRLSKDRLIKHAEACGFVIESEGAIVGIPIYALSLLPRPAQRMMLSVDSALVAILGGSYHWILCRKPLTSLPSAPGDTCKSF